MRKLLVLLLFPLSVLAQQRKYTSEEISRWEKQAHQVTIIRDQWGIPHIYGKTDADCVFGLLYAQCEDDFKRVESNYIEKLGRTAEVSGEKSLYEDLYTRLVLDSTGAIADYKKSPAWLKKLLNAFADGVNYYLYKNPSVKPELLFRFQPWYQLMWTDGSIGAIQTGGISPDEVKGFYSGNPSAVTMVNYKQEEELPTGSNGFAIAPSKSASGNAILYINPHVTFYFRPEVHVSSEEGLNAYGAVTWGQLFVYQGFNAHCGWMHTSGYSDAADIYAEQVTQKGDSFYYKYNNNLRALQQKTISLRYKDGGSTLTKKFTVYSTHHGPVMAKRNGQWMSVRSNNRSMNSLIQSWDRTKSKGFEDFKKTMGLLSNCSNNTVFADDKGNIAYWHGNFIPRRDTSFNWQEPVDGSITATEWKGLHTVDETIHLYNPSSGWIQNCNSTPFTVSGVSSPKKESYPTYMAPEPDNFRGINAVRLLDKESTFTIDKIIASGYDTYLSYFEQLVPAFVAGFEKEIPKEDSLYNQLIQPVETLKNWDLRSSASSIATTLAIEWAQQLQRKINHVRINGQEVDFITRVQAYAAKPNIREMAESLLAAVNNLYATFGNWQIAWGEINRYQRLTGRLEETYDDQEPSIAVGMASSMYGCIPSFVSRTFNGTKKRYGYNGNSFICAIEFGKTIKAKSLLAGGESGSRSSKHFDDQAKMYTTGQFKDVLFYKQDVLKHAEKTYHPGQ